MPYKVVPDIFMVSEVCFHIDSSSWKQKKNCTLRTGSTESHTFVALSTFRIKLRGICGYSNVLRHFMQQFLWYRGISYVYNHQTKK